uniref:homocitrate synthase n=1 Tax=Lotharella globosa TaxID=91324 RepID=A0A7S4DX45_9EUKA|mmetsp:Transcript_27470/g.53497  ORF Transcript_27470/g.53497 Transcript_27470/m.53497 type:complete len:531 (+) Transcript_27470:30-1622(+)
MRLARTLRRPRPAHARHFSDAATKGFSECPDFKIVDSTLREGEQFATTDFTPQDRMYIAKILDRMGVDYIEMVNPMAGKQAVEDCENVAKLGLKSKILVHTRCHMSDVKAAVNTGVQGINLYMATSPVLSKHSHGKGIDVIIETATKVVEYVKEHGLEVRFSCEDSFRSDMSDCVTIYKAMDAIGVDRVGVADTVGIATPKQVEHVISTVRANIKPTTGIEFHTHNDTGCCIANALVALEAGATHIDTCVLGLGERNGITPLGGFLARLYTLDKDLITERYDLSLLKHLERYVAQHCHVTIPFNNYVTGSCAFTHKAGVHSKAVMQNPSAYEVIDPSDFGVERRIELAHRLTGWNAMKQRTQDLGLEIPDEKLKIATVMIKDLSDERTIGLEELDKILMSLCSKRQPKAAFVAWGEDAHEHKADFYRRETEDAIKMLDANEDTRPSEVFRFTGHLFDKAVLNRLLDLAVDSPVDFKVVKLDVPNDNEQQSSAIIKVIGELNDIEVLRQKYENLLSTLDGVARTQMSIEEQ